MREEIMGKKMDLDFLRKPENICAATMIGFFFMPWTQLFGLGASGFQIARLGSYGNLVWVIPILAGVMLFTAFNGTSNKALQITTGVAPFVGLVYVVAKLRSDIFHVLAIGSYLTLIAGAGIIVFALGFAGKKSTTT